MTATLVFTAPFEADVRSQVEWLRADGRASWVDKLRLEFDEAFGVLQEFPYAGVATDVRGRKLLLRKMPFAIRYVLENRNSRVVLLALTHGRRRKAARR